MERLDWSALHDVEFMSLGSCWETCGSYCCTNFHGRDFRILDPEAVVLPLPEGEYRHYQAMGGMATMDPDVRTETFRIKPSAELTIHFLTCRAKGRCEPPSLRPLICKIYPFFPLVDVQGNIRGFQYAAFADLLYARPGESHPCTVARERAEEAQAMLSKSLSPFLKHPELIFYFQCMEALADSLKARQGGCLDEVGSDEERAKFLKRFEWNLFSRSAWTNKEFQGRVLGLHDALENEYGPFLAPEGRQ